MDKTVPSFDSLRIASYILKYFEDRKMKPSAVETLYEGGIGIAWSTIKHYVDLEIDNETNVIFAFSKDRKKIEFYTISTVDNIADIADILNKIVEMIKE